MFGVSNSSGQSKTLGENNWRFYNSNGELLAVLAAGVAVDHGTLLGLSDDDHTQYALLAGRSGGQILRGGTGSGDDITIRSTSNATKGDVFLADEGGNIIIGGGATASRLRLLEASGNGTNYTEFVVQPQAANITYTLPPDDGDPDDILSTDGSGGLSWAAAGAGSTINVEELDGAPSVSGVGTVIFDQGDGFSVTDNMDGSVTIGVSAGGFNLTIEEEDGAPSVSNVDTIVFDQADGFTVTDNTGGQVTIGFSGGSGSGVGKQFVLMMASM